VSSRCFSPPLGALESVFGGRNREREVAGEVLGGVHGAPPRRTSLRRPDRRPSPLDAPDAIRLKIDGKETKIPLRGDFSLRDPGIFEN